MSKIKDVSKMKYIKIISIVMACILACGLLSVAIIFLTKQPQDNPKALITMTTYYADDDTVIKADNGGIVNYVNGNSSQKLTSVYGYVGEQIKLIAQPENGYAFMGFFRDDSFTDVLSYEKQYNYTIQEEDNNIVAKFVKEYEVTFSFVDANSQQKSVRIMLPYGMTYGQKDILQIVAENPNFDASLYQDKIAKLELKSTEAQKVEKTNMNFTVASGNTVFSISPASLDDVGLSGAGNKEMPYQINNATELATFRDIVNGLSTTASAKLMSDITLTGTWTPIGNIAANAAYVFSGVFDGNGKTISGLTLNIGTDYNAFIGQATNSVVKDLTLVGTSSQGAKTYHGAFVGRADNSIIENCVSKVNLSSSSGNTGGIVGYAANSTIRNCVNEGKISHAASNGGGIVGYIITNSTIENCYNKGVLTFNGSYVGGVIGIASTNVIVNNCYNVGDITQTGTGSYFGGVVGHATTDIKLYNCYNTAFVLTGGPQVGGIIGNAYQRTYLYSCYNTGDVKCTASYEYKAGIVGYGNGDTHTFIYNCYNSGNIISAANNHTAGISGYAGTIYNCYNSGKISGTGSYNAGIVADYGIVYNCCNYGEVVYADLATAGGIGNRGTYFYCYSANDQTYYNRAYTVCGNGSRTFYCSTFEHNGITNRLAEESAFDKDTLIENLNYWVLGQNKQYYSSWGCSLEENNGMPMLRYAKTESAFVVTFNTNGGNYIPQEYHYYNSDIVYGSLPTPTKMGYIFDGWFTDANLTNLVMSTSSITTHANHTLYAKWIKDEDANYVNAMVGEGTSVSPYLISTPFQLYVFARFAEARPNTCAKLTKDISLEYYVWQPIGKDSIYESFYTNNNHFGYSGTFDGDNHKITNIVINSSENFNGFFASICGGTVKNVTFQGANITSTQFSAGICAAAKSATFSNVNNEIYVLGNTARLSGFVAYNFAPFNDTSMPNTKFINCTNYAHILQYANLDTTAGLVGVGFCCDFVNCHNEGKITSFGHYLAGICAYTNTYSASFTDCSNSGKIIQKATYSYNAGICGYANTNVTFTNCSNLGEIDLSVANHYNGGICGWAENNVTFNLCYNTVDLFHKNGYSHLGGICGYSRTNITYDSCYNIGNLKTTGAYIGGITGFAHNLHTIKDCYNSGSITTTDISSDRYASGICSKAESATTFINCYNNGNINAGGRSAGICGYALSVNTTFTDCCNTGTITSSSYDMGGIAGRADNCQFKNCYNTADIKGTNTSVGGICGYGYSNTALFVNCYNTGRVSCGVYYGGGICGYAGTFYNCYNTGYVEALRGNDTDYAGGIVGAAGVLYNCYNAGTIYVPVSYSGGCGVDATSNYCYSTSTFSGSGSYRYAISATANNCSVFTHTGSTSNVLTTATYSTTDLLTALNAWVNSDGAAQNAKRWSISSVINNGFPYFEVATDNVTFNVVFDYGSGECDTSVVKYSYGQEYYGYLPTPIAPYGYNFDGWFTGKNGTGMLIEDGAEITNKSNHTLYAKYSPIISKIEFNYGEGEGSTSTINVSYGSVWPQLPTPTTIPVGKHFVGWFTTLVNGDRIIAGEKVNFIENATLYAVYAEMDGIGTEDNPYLITTTEEFTLFRNWVNQGNVFICAKLMNDIQLQGKWDPIGDYAVNNAWFYSGVFDGNGHKVEGLSISINRAYRGLFGYCSYATIKNLSVYGNVEQLANTAYTGGICGYAKFTKFENCINYVDVISYGQHVGGVCGSAYSSMVFDGCENYGDISSEQHYIGGICGYITSINVNFKNVFNDCYNNGYIQQRSTNYHTAGICGICYYTDINNCVNEGMIETNGHYNGGIVSYAENTCNIRDCHNSGFLKMNTGYSHLAGIAGYIYASVTIENCYNTGEIDSKGYYGAGICGYARGTASIVNCWNTANLKTSVITAETWFAGILSKGESGTMIRNCWNTGDIECGSTSGGIVGYIMGGTGSIVEYCYNTGDIIAPNINLGGIAGATEWVSIYNCYNTGNITSTTSTGEIRIGGIYGWNNSNNLRCINCYNTGTISAKGWAVGGIGGRYGIAYNCYNTGNITSTRTDNCHVAGIIGCDGGSYNCYNSGNITGSSHYVGGIGSYSHTASYCYNSGTVKSLLTSATNVFPIAPTATDNCTTFTHRANSTTNTLATSINGTTDLTTSLISWINAQTNPAQYTTWRALLSDNYGYPTFSTAQGSPEEFVVTFDPNGGVLTGYPRYKFVQTSTTYTYIPNIASRLGYIFVGWFSAQTGGVQIQTTTNFVTKKDHTIYARWQKQNIQGDGTTHNPYLLASETDLVAFRDWVNLGNFNLCAKLTADITLTQEWTPIANYFINNNFFYGGVFDGNSHTITINNFKQTNFMALFGATNGAYIHDLYVSGTGIGNAYSASIVGHATYSEFRNCVSSATITVNGERGSGLFGNAVRSKIINCGFTGYFKNTSTGAYNGGIVGYGDYTNIYDCYNAGEIHTNGHYVGGICGYANYTNFYDCYNTGDVMIDNGYERVGGIVGHIVVGTIDSCYNTGNLSVGPRYIGGIASSGASAILIKCYNSGTVTQRDGGTDKYYVAGIIGIGDGGCRYYSCYNDADLSYNTASYVAGICGRYGIAYNCCNNGRLRSTAGTYLTINIIAGDGTVYNSFSVDLTGLKGTVFGFFGSNPTCYYVSNNLTKTWKFDTEVITHYCRTTDVVVALNSYVDIQSDQTKFSLWYYNENMNNVFISQRDVYGADFVVTFDAGISSCLYSQLAYHYNEGRYSTLPHVIAVDNHVFAGWFTQPVGGEEITTQSEFISYNSHTLYAHYKSLLGCGTEAEPYLIYNANDLAIFRDHVNYGYNNMHVKLMDDIDLSVYNNWTPIADWGHDQSLIYSGVFDGNGHRIYNLNIIGDTTCTGLIGMARYATIKNLGIESGSVVGGGNYTGAIVGATTTFQSIPTKFINCYNAINVTSPYAYVGGLCGYDGTFYNCYNVGNISSTLQFKENYVGGIVGYVTQVIYNCYNAGDISSAYNFAGGIAAWTTSAVYRSYRLKTCTLPTWGNVYTVSNNCGDCNGDVLDYPNTTLIDSLNWWVLQQTVDLQYSLWYVVPNVQNAHPMLRVFTDTDFVVTYDANGGTIFNDTAGYYNDEIYYGKLPLINRTGYNFVGWFTDSYGDVQVLETSKILEHKNHTLYARWQITNYTTFTVSFDNYGATIGGTGSVVVKYGVMMPDILLPVKTGFVFGGYFSDYYGLGTQYYDAYGRALIPYDKVVNITLRAFWVLENQCVEFDEQGATESGTLSVNAVFLQDMPRITIPQKEGYIFMGYFTEPDGNGKMYYTKEGTSANAWNNVRDTKLYAYWVESPDEKVTYLVFFDMQGGTSGTVGLQATFGDHMYAIDIPVREGFVFRGYYTDKDGQGTQYFTESGACSRECDFTNDIILYAYWTAMPIVQMNANIEGVNVNLFSMNAYSGNIGDMEYEYNCSNGIITFNGTPRKGDFCLVPLSSPTVGTVYTITEYRLGGYLSTTNVNKKAGFVFEITDIHGNAEERNYINYNSFSITSSEFSFSGTLSPITTKNIENGETYIKIWYYQEDDVIIYVNGLQEQFKIEIGQDVTKYSPDSKHVKYNTIYGALQTPERKGYNFLGWYTEAEEGEQITARHYRSKLSDGMLYAQYEPCSIQINFYDGQTLLASREFMLQDSEKLPKFTSLLLENELISGALNQYGWSFMGWTISQDSVEVTYIDGWAISDDMEPGITIDLYSVYKKTLNVTYKGNGATSGSVSDNTVTQTINSYSLKMSNWSVTVRENGFAKTGYSFVNWHLSAPNGKVISPNYILTQQDITLDYTKSLTVTLYAEWEGNKYTVNYYSGTNKIGSSEHVYGTKSQLTSWTQFNVENEYSGYGWNFYGWSLSDISYTAGYSECAEVVTMTTESEINLYSVFTRKITFLMGRSDAPVQTIVEQYWNNCSDGENNLSFVTAPKPQVFASEWSPLGYRDDLLALPVTYSVTLDKDIKPNITDATDLYAIYVKTIKIYEIGKTTEQTQYYNTSGAMSAIIVNVL